MDILIINALNGVLAQAARKKYPDASITCLEWFDHYVPWLRRQGFDVLCLDEDLKNWKRELGDMKFDLILGNPPYNEKNVKIGGGLFIKFLEKTIPMTSKICMIVPNTFMFRRDCESIRQQLIQNGLKEIYHLPSNTFGANVKTCVIYLDKSYKEDYFVQSDNGNQLQFPIEKYLSGDTIPYTLDENDRQFFEHISSLSSSRRIKSGSEKSSKHRVAWEYLIGLDENRFQREVIVRKIRHEPPGILTRNQCYVEVDNEEQASSLVAFLEEHAHRFVRMIPRGSSVEGWMMQPLIGFAEKCGVLTDYSINYIEESSE